jgi:3'-5' exoribonuclease
MLLNELTDGVEIEQILLVREPERRRRRDGGDYLRLLLSDRTGAVACVVWEELAEVEELARAGTPVRVSGRYTVHPRFGPQINLRGIEPATEESFDPADLRDDGSSGGERGYEGSDSVQPPLPARAAA